MAAGMKTLRLASLILLVLLAACGGSASPWHATEIAGALPALDFALTRAKDGVPVHGADYRGRITMLYFGYTHCPDVCPTTLANLAEVLDKMGPRAAQIHVLFVTVDPSRDTLAQMKSYAASFSPQIDGLRGTPDQLTALARRYRVAFSVTQGPPYEVMHSNAVFFFDQDGRARLVATKTDDIAGMTADLDRLLGGS
jgi:protein SCO1/2